MRLHKTSLLVSLRELDQLTPDHALSLFKPLQYRRNGELHAPFG